MTALARRLTGDATIIAFFCPGCRHSHHLPLLGSTSQEIWGWNQSHDKPTFTPSVKVWHDKRDGTPQTDCHSWVSEGRINFLDDSLGHTLRGWHDLIPFPEGYGVLTDMRLEDLDAEFFRWDVKGVTHVEIPTVGTLAEAQGVMFDCPVCESSGHSIMVGFRDRGVPPDQGTRDAAGNQTLWTVAGGTGLHDLTLTPSIDCTPSNPACWHGFITNGEIT